MCPVFGSNIFTIRNLVSVVLTRRRFLDKSTDTASTSKFSVVNRMIDEDRNGGAVQVLTERLTKAEKRLKVLSCEISSIKAELAALRQSPATSFREFSTSTRRLLSDTDGLGAPSSKKPCYEFIREDGYVVVFTDGACENNGKANAKAGIGIWFGRGHPLNVSEPVRGRPTNNTAEIQACICAVNIARENGITKLKIKTDSQFVINSMTQWIHRWKKNNWKVQSGGHVKNKEDFVVLDNAIKQMESVTWEHVDGHKGIDGNEEADRLARAGALRYM